MDDQFVGDEEIKIRGGRKRRTELSIRITGLDSRTKAALPFPTGKKKDPTPNTLL